MFSTPDQPPSDLTGSPLQQKDFFGRSAKKFASGRRACHNSPSGSSPEGFGFGH